MSMKLLLLFFTLQSEHFELRRFYTDELLPETLELLRIYASVAFNEREHVRITFRKYRAVKRLDRKQTDSVWKSKGWMDFIQDSYIILLFYIL